MIHSFILIYIIFVNPEYDTFFYLDLNIIFVNLDYDTFLLVDTNYFHKSSL